VEGVPAPLAWMRKDVPRMICELSSTSSPYPFRW
jgi:hypothetical protein